MEGHKALPCTGTIVARGIVTFASIWNYAGIFSEPMAPDIMRKCTNTKKVIGKPNHSLHFRREDRIRTCDHLVPNQERYRTALLPESVVFVLRVQRYNNLFIPQNFSLFFFLIYKRIGTSHSSCWLLSQGIAKGKAIAPKYTLYICSKKVNERSVPMHT